MPNVVEFASAGLAAIQVGPRNSSSLFNGMAQLVAANTGMASGMRRIKGAITAPVSVNEPNRISIHGDDGVVARFQFASADDNGFTLEMGVTDLTFESFAQGTTPYVLGTWTMGPRGIPLPTFKDLCLLLCRQSQNKVTGGAGNGYENMLVLSTQVLPLGDDQFAWQGDGGDRYACIANLASVLPWSVTVATAVVGATQVTTMTWFSDNPCSMDALIGDGSIVAIPLTYAPVGTAVTQVYRTDTVAIQTVSSINAGSKTATIAVAAASGKLYVTLYECLGLI